MVKFDGNWLCWNRCPRSEIRKTENLFGSIKIFADKDHDNKLTVGIWVLYFLNPRLIIKKFKKILVIFTLWIISKIQIHNLPYDLLNFKLQIYFQKCTGNKLFKVKTGSSSWYQIYMVSPLPCNYETIFFSKTTESHLKNGDRLTFVKRASNFYHIYAFLSFKEGQQLAR